MERKEIQVSSQSTSLATIEIGTTADLLKAKPMIIQISEHGKEAVLLEILSSVKKCCIGIGIEMSDEAQIILAKDILDVYRYDSIEDVIWCLKKGRQGEYGFGLNNRRSFSMLVVREWMSKHLEEKASARERELSKFKNKEEHIDSVDYEAYKVRVNENRKKPKPNNSEENKYQDYKNRYLGIYEKEKKEKTKKVQSPDRRK